MTNYDKFSFSSPINMRILFPKSDSFLKKCLFFSLAPKKCTMKSILSLNPSQDREKGNNGVSFHI